MVARTLPRLTMQNAIVNKLFQPTTLFLRFFNNEVLKAIEEQLADIQDQIDRLNATLRNTSYTVDLVMEGVADGATAKITVSAHSRVYTDETVTLDAGEVDGLLYNTVYNVYYDDADRTGGAVTYAVATLASDATTSSANPNRHLLGVVTTPANSGDPPTSGSGSAPPGYPKDYLWDPL